MITYATNTDTSTVVRNMLSQATPPAVDGEGVPALAAPPITADVSALRILLETDAPYMVPANLYDDLPAIRGKKLPICHTAMVPWTAKFVSNLANGGAGAVATEGAWTADEVMRVARENARKVYGV